MNMQSTIKSFRVLTEEELDVVAGGEHTEGQEIVATGKQGDKVVMEGVSVGLRGLSASELNLVSGGGETINGQDIWDWMIKGLPGSNSTWDGGCGGAMLNGWWKGSWEGAVAGGVAGGMTGAVMGGPGGALGGAIIGGGIGAVGNGAWGAIEGYGDCAGWWE